MPIIDSVREHTRYRVREIKVNIYMVAYNDGIHGDDDYNNGDYDDGGGGANGDYDGDGDDGGGGGGGDANGYYNYDGDYDGDYDYGDCYDGDDACC